MANKSGKAVAQRSVEGPGAAVATPLVTDSVDVNIVGIGASAGGLEALELFLRNVEPDCGLAFVVVQHLDPTHKGMMVELLQRATCLPVVQIDDALAVVPNHVYVIPPNRDLSILHGVLYLLEPVAPRGLRLPIDHFFRALAADQRERSLGVILSGMGSDGTLGLRAIKEQAGAVFVQEPATAKFDGMPRSAIEAGLADVVAPAEELIGRILAYLRHIPLAQDQTAAALADRNQSGLDKVVLILRAQTGHDFSHYKKSSLYRRIERRMSLHQLPKIADYARYLRENSQEGKLLFKELLIGVTNFFRDPAAWEQLGSAVIPALLAAHPEGGTLRAWTAACSTGEEAYTLAIVFREALEQIKPAVHYDLQIFATDLDPDAIDRARAAAYPANIAADVSEARLRRYFVQDERGYKVTKDIREMVIFATQNLVMDPPFTRLDLLTCRNLLIYLDADLQKKLLPLFHYSLNPGGVLMLGSSETIGQAGELFTALPGMAAGTSANHARLYRRQENTPRAVPATVSAAFPAVFSPTPADPALTPPPSPGNLQSLTDALLLRQFSPAAVLTTGQGDLVYISGRTGKYLEPAAGHANLNLFAMAREGLAGPLATAFPRAVREGAGIVLKNLQVGTNGGAQQVDVTVQPLTEPATLRGMVLVVFTEVTTPAEAPAAKRARGKGRAQDAQVAALNEELLQAREALQITREEMQTAQEELKSANEELQSTNEELQSTNEELTTSKEEMQSMNEELQTVNHELTAKVDELSQAGDDMKNLLNSIDIATLFLDESLKVRRFTPQTTGIIKLIPGDAGRPVTDLASELDYPNLAADAQEVLRTLVFQERQVAARDGRWFKVRVMPYRTQNNRIDGIVITFIDISATKALESSLREALTLLQGRYDSQMAKLDTAGELEAALRQAQAVLEQRLADLAGGSNQNQPGSKP